MKSLSKNPIVAVPLRQQTLNGLRQAIISGELEPGQRLREAELSLITGVSRSVVREALCRLEAEGLVATIPNKGAVVKLLSPDEAVDIYRVRTLIEGFAAKLFVENASEELMQRLVDAGNKVIAAHSGGGVNTILKAKEQFYAVLYEGSGSEVLQSLYQMLNARISRWRARGLWDQMNGGSDEQSIRDMSAIVEAIERRDAVAAEQRVRERVMTAVDKVMRSFDHL